MVCIAFDKGVKDAFSKVKDDILNLKRSVNRELHAIEELGGRFQSAVLKEEFYSFIKRLGERLDKIEASIERYSGAEDSIKEVDAKVAAVARRISRRDDLAAELRTVRKLKSQIDELQSTSVSSKKFGEEIRSLTDRISQADSRAVNVKDAARLKTELLQMAEKLAADISEGKKAFDAAIGESKKSLDAAEQGLKAEMASVSDNMVRKEVFDKKLADVNKQVSSINSTLDRSVSDVDLNDYVTKKDFDAAVSKMDGVSRDVNRISQGLSAVEENFKQLQKKAATLEDVGRIGDEVRGISKSIDVLKSAIQKFDEASRERVERSLRQAASKFEKDLGKVKAAANGKKGKGFFAKLSDGFADFFKEELPESPKKEKKSEFSVSEFLKSEEKKAARSSYWKYAAGALLLLLAGAGFLFYFTAGEPNQDVPKLSEDAGEAVSGSAAECIEFECKLRAQGEYWFNCYVAEEGGCRCFVTDAAGCGIAEPAEESGEPLVGSLYYLIGGGMILAVLAVVYFILSRGEEKPPKDENGIDLEGFFEKKN
ncbi:hypothetical protein HYX10_05585 [Candidatus Woesearchaeota archaeon]|nr:hypothetical protein [Candidatus Woesearchaeota archaeon]